MKKISGTALLNHYFYQIPPKKGIYVYLDTETKNGLLTEIGACKIINGQVIFFDKFYYKVPEHSEDQIIAEYNRRTEKKNFIKFLKWSKNYLIFCHNAPYDSKVLRTKFMSLGIPPISYKNFRCSMRIFKAVVGFDDPKYRGVQTKLNYCCDYFGIYTFPSLFHGPAYDAIMGATVVSKLYHKIDSNPLLQKYYNYNEKIVGIHYKNYLMLKARNKQKNNNTIKEKIIFNEKILNINKKPEKNSEKEFSIKNLSSSEIRDKIFKELDDLKKSIK